MARRPYSCRLDSRKIAGECNIKAIKELDPSSYSVANVDSLSIGGDAPKDFFIIGRSDKYSESYIAKGARVCGPRECVTEELISRIGRMLPLKVASSKLVRITSPKTKEQEVRFMSRYFLRSGEELVHGVELLAMWLNVEQREMEEVFLSGEKRLRKDQERFLYSIDGIHDVLKDLCRHGEFEQVKDGFGRMLAFDALVGSMDRHAMNWGVIRNVHRRGPFKFAPIFDTARGLFWHHLDSDLLKLQQSGGRDATIAKYADRSEPLMGCRHHVGGPLNHFDLIQYIMDRREAEYGTCVRQIIRAFDPDATRKMMYLRFGKIFSELRLEYISDLLRFRHQRLKRICRLGAP